MTCPKCGYSLPEDSEFCQYCGTPLELQATSDVLSEDTAASGEAVALAPVVREPTPEEVSESAAPLPDANQEESLFCRAYNSYISNDPKARLFFEEMLGTDELRTAYLKECERNKRDYDSGLRVSHKESYTNFMGALYKEYFGLPVSQSSTLQISDEKPAEEPKTNKLRTRSKQHYCTVCGQIIDSSTKKCTGCGKQYFNAKKIVPIVFLSLLLAVSVSLNVIQYLQGKKTLETVATQTTKIEKLEKDVATQKGTISAQKSKISDLKKEVDELDSRCFDLFSDLYFYKEYAAIVPNDGTKKYHIYGCEDCDVSYFWIYNVDAAEQNGYYPCPKCYNN